MHNSKISVSIVVATALFTFASLAQAAEDHADSKLNTYLTAEVTDVTAQYAAAPAASPSPSPKPSATPDPLFPGGSDPFAVPSPSNGSDPFALPTPGKGSDPFSTGSGFGGGFGSSGCIPGFDCGGYGSGKFDLSTIFTIGQKVWEFVVTNKPNADYKTMKASVLPGGATSFTQLKGWSKPVSKVYHVEFKNILGKSAGGFDYRIVFVYGGGYQGKGKYIGQISFAPLNIKLKTDRQLNIRAEVLDPLNYGTEEDPVAGVQLLISWSSPTTLRYSMNSIEYFFYGNGDVQDVSNGGSAGKLPLQ